MDERSLKQSTPAVATDEARAALKEAAALKPAHRSQARTRVRASMWSHLEDRPRPLDGGGSEETRRAEKFVPK